MRRIYYFVIFCFFLLTFGSIYCSKKNKTITPEVSKETTVSVAQNVEIILQEKTKQVVVHLEHASYLDQALILAYLEKQFPLTTIQQDGEFPHVHYNITHANGESTHYTLLILMNKEEENTQIEVINYKDILGQMEYNENGSFVRFPKYVIDQQAFESRGINDFSVITKNPQALYHFYAEEEKYFVTISFLDHKNAYQIVEERKVPTNLQIKSFTVKNAILLEEAKLDHEENEIVLSLLADTPNPFEAELTMNDVNASSTPLDANFEEITDGSVPTYYRVSLASSTSYYQLKITTVAVTGRDTKIKRMSITGLFSSKEENALGDGLSILRFIGGEFPATLTPENHTIELYNPLAQLLKYDANNNLLIGDDYPFPAYYEVHMGGKVQRYNVMLIHPEDTQIKEFIFQPFSDLVTAITLTHGPIKLKPGFMDFDDPHTHYSNGQITFVLKKDYSQNFKPTIHLENPKAILYKYDTNGSQFFENFQPSYYKVYHQAAQRKYNVAVFQVSDFYISNYELTQQAEKPVIDHGTDLENGTIHVKVSEKNFNNLATHYEPVIAYDQEKMTLTAYTSTNKIAQKGQIPSYYIVEDTFKAHQKRYDLVVTQVANSTEAKITKFALKDVNSKEIVEADEINHTTKIITITVTGLANQYTNVAPAELEISDKATVSPAKNTPVDFSKDATYIVTAENGDVVKYTVITTIIPISNEAKILSFKLNNVEAKTINHQTGEIIVPFFGEELAILNQLQDIEPMITISDKATIDKKGKQNFSNLTNPVTYTVTAEDGKTKTIYKILIQIKSNQNARILNFKLKNVDATTINHETGEIIVPFVGEQAAVLDRLKDIEPMITISDKATIDKKGKQNFSDLTNPVTYTVTAEDGEISMTYQVNFEFTKINCEISTPLELQDVSILWPNAFSNGGTCILINDIVWPDNIRFIGVDRMNSIFDGNNRIISNLSFSTDPLIATLPNSEYVKTHDLWFTSLLSLFYNMEGKHREIHAQINNLNVQDVNFSLTTASGLNSVHASVIFSAKSALQDDTTEVSITNVKVSNVKVIISKALSVSKPVHFSFGGIVALHNKGNLKINKVVVDGLYVNTQLSKSDLGDVCIGGLVAENSMNTNTIEISSSEIKNSQFTQQYTRQANEAHNSYGGIIGHMTIGNSSKIQDVKLSNITFSLKNEDTERMRDFQNCHTKGMSIGGLIGCLDNFRNTNQPLELNRIEMTQMQLSSSQFVVPLGGFIGVADYSTPIIIRNSYFQGELIYDIKYLNTFFPSGLFGGSTPPATNNNNPNVEVENIYFHFTDKDTRTINAFIEKPSNGITNFLQVKESFYTQHPNVKDEANYGKALSDQDLKKSRFEQAGWDFTTIWKWNTDGTWPTLQNKK